MASEAFPLPPADKDPVHIRLQQRECPYTAISRVSFNIPTSVKKEQIARTQTGAIRYILLLGP